MRRDKFVDTVSGFRSAVAVDRSSWEKQGDGYTGILYGLPDRGWNTAGTINEHWQGRIHKFQLTSTPKPEATIATPASPNLQFNGPHRS